MPSQGVTGSKYPLRLEDYAPVTAPVAAYAKTQGQARRQAPLPTVDQKSLPHPTRAGASVIDVRSGSTRGKRLRTAFITAGSTASLDLSQKEQLNLQSFVLELSQQLFSNEFNNDGAIKHHVGLKQAHFKDHGIDDGEAEAVFYGLTRAEQQRRCLAVILLTFRHSDDAELRVAAFNKIAEVGNLSCLPLLMDWVRRGTSADLYHGLNALRRIATRCSTPPPRRRLNHDPDIGPILSNPHRSDAEASRAIVSVLQYGSIRKLKRLGGGLNRNEVWFITFNDKLTMADGRREPIRGVFKPERCWPDKDKAYFPREVASFDFEHQFVGSNLIPPTIEAMLSPAGSAELGSLQYLVPQARTLGQSARVWDPELEHLKDNDEFGHALSQARLLLYLLGDPDKLANNIHPHPNLLNFLVDENGKLWMIDNSYNLGAAPEPDDGLLPEPGSVPGISKTIADSDHDDVRSVLTLYVGNEDADGWLGEWGSRGPSYECVGSIPRAAAVR